MCKHIWEKGSLPCGTKAGFTSRASRPNLPSQEFGKSDIV